MRSINKVILVGNLTRDPEMRRTAGSQNIALFGLATNREWVTKDGRKEQSSEFHEVVCWGRLAEIACQYLKKGKLVYIEGYLKTRREGDPSGVKKFRTEIVAQDLIMLSKRPKDGEPDAYETNVPQSGVVQDVAAAASSLQEKSQDGIFDSSTPSITVENPYTI